MIGPVNTDFGESCVRVTDEFGLEGFVCPSFANDLLHSVIDLGCVIVLVVGGSATGTRVSCHA
jgi:hypothetical protein